MLSDTERKLLRILFNRNRNDAGRMDIDMLCRLSQRTKEQVLTALERIRSIGYIERDPVTNQMRVIKTEYPNPERMPQYRHPWEEYLV